MGNVRTRSSHHVLFFAQNALKSDVPSTVEYALEGVKVSLDLLRRAAVFVPVPYVRSAVEIAIGLIEIGEVCLHAVQDSFTLTLADRTCSQIFST